MGVTGLWRLIEPSGKPVPLDTLENKVLAVDISIWLHQAIKGFQDSRGAPVPNAHLLSLFNRLCKLLYYRVKPVFVFDGGVPVLKKETIAKRHQSKNKYQDESDRIQKQLLATLTKHTAVNKVLADKLNVKISPTKISPTKISPVKKDTSKEDDLFKLPPMNLDSMTESDIEDDDDTSTEDSSPSSSWGNLHTIDVQSTAFKTLPADIRRDILSDLKETRKQSSWGRLHELPDQSDDFSSFQMKRLRKRRAVQVSLEEAELEMGGRSLSMGELEQILTEEGIVAASNSASSRRIASDENTRYLLIKDVKKAMETAQSVDAVSPTKLAMIEEEDEDGNVVLNKVVLTESSVEIETKKTSLNSDCVVDLTQPSTSKYVTVDDSLGEEFDAELDEAIRLSLQNVSNKHSHIENNVKPTDEDNDKYQAEKKINEGGTDDTEWETMITNECSNDIFYTEKHKKLLASTNMSLARSYMIENAGLTQEEILKVIASDKAKSQEQTDYSNFDFSLSKENKELLAPTVKHKITKENEDILVIESSDSDSDFVDVPESSEISVVRNIFPPAPLLEVVIKPDLIGKDELFDDIFEDIKITNINQNVSQNSKDEIRGAQGKKIDTTIEIDEEERKESKDTVNVKIQKITRQVSQNSKTEQSKTLTDITTIDSGDNKVEFNEKITVQMMNQDEIRDKHTPEDQTGLITGNSKETESMHIENENVYRPENSNESNLHASESEEIEILKMPDIPKTPPPRLQITEDELRAMAHDLEEESNILMQAKSKQDRMGNSITEQMTRDAQELLELFGMPFITAPMEAEAQCAFLNDIKLTDGTITDDSDIWLFGGNTVYKNFFNQKKHVMEFLSGNIFNYFKLTRGQLIQLALLVGSDYTTGLQGVGPVTALEILAAFPNQKPNDMDQLQIVSSLQQFKMWFIEGRAVGPGKTALKNKLKNVSISEGFPSVQVVQAYLEPTVETSKEQFSWGNPDIAMLTDYTRTKFGWSKTKTDSILMPILSKINQKTSQATIKNYFSVKSSTVAGIENKLSKRVQVAVEKMSKPAGSQDNNEEAADKKPAKPRRKQNKETKSKHNSIQNKNPEEAAVLPTEFLETFKKPVVTHKIPRIPNTKVAIPQKEMDKAKILENKMKAIEIFRKSKCGPGYKKKRQKTKPVVKDDAGLSESSDDEC